MIRIVLSVRTHVFFSAVLKSAVGTPGVVAVVATPARVAPFLKAELCSILAGFLVAAYKTSL
jgi:hypothetical protein